MVKLKQGQVRRMKTTIVRAHTGQGLREDLTVVVDLFEADGSSVRVSNDTTQYFTGPSVGNISGPTGPDLGGVLPRLAAIGVPGAAPASNVVAIRKMTNALTNGQMDRDETTVLTTETANGLRKDVRRTQDVWQSDGSGTRLIDQTTLFLRTGRIGSFLGTSGQGHAGGLPTLSLFCTTGTGGSGAPAANPAGVAAGSSAAGNSSGNATGPKGNTKGKTAKACKPKKP